MEYEILTNLIRILEQHLKVLKKALGDESFATLFLEEMIEQFKEAIEDMY